MDSLPKGWFSEVQKDLWPGQAMSLEIKSKVHEEQSQYQHVEVFETATYGKLLTIDGNIQLTERDEFAYQEMMAHPALCAHPNPRRVLVVGGGDGGVLREVIKHDCVEEVILCEIDPTVIEVSKKYLPSLAVGFESPKVKVVIEDGFKYLGAHKKAFDVIITDAPDPVGPGAALFQMEFYTLVRDALRENGIMCCQAENIWLHMELIKDIVTQCTKLFGSVAYGFTYVPTYPSGSLGFVVCSLDDVDVTKPTRIIDAATQDKMRYYTPEMHAAAFALPHFARKPIEQARREALAAKAASS